MRRRGNKYTQNEVPKDAEDIQENERRDGEGSKTFQRTSREGSRSTESDRSLGLAQRFVRRALLARRMLYPQVRTDSGKLPFWTKLVYAAPALALTSLTMLISIHGTIFFTKIGAKVAFLAFFTALARSFDVVTDPLMGYFSDGCKLKLGRRRPFMLAGCWFYAGFFILLGGHNKNVPFNALGPELTEEASERNSLFFYYGLFKAVGILMAAVAPVMLIFYFKSDSGVNCDAQVPLGMSYAASNGYNWSVEAWGNYSDDVYNYFLLCNDKTCNPMCDPALPGCDISLRNGEACAPGLDQWCADRYDCDTACDIGATRAGFHLTSMLFGGYYVIAMLVCVYLISERKNFQGSPKTPPLIPALLRTMRNRPFMTLVGPWALDYTAYTMIGTMLPFYVLYVVRPQDASPWCDDGQRCPGIFPCARDEECCSADAEDPNWCTADYWLGIGFRLDECNHYFHPDLARPGEVDGQEPGLAPLYLLAAVTNGMFVFVGEGDPKLCVFMAMMNGLPNGAMFLNESILADVIDYEEFLTGERSEGRFTIFQTFIPKVVSIPAQAIPLGLLAAFGFVQPVNGVSQPQPPAVNMFIKVVFFVLPCGLALLSFCLKTLYPIKTSKQMQQITEGVALHMKGLPAFDPISKKMATPFSFSSADEETMTWKMDCFFLPQLKLLATKGPAPLEKQIRFTLAQLILITTGVLVIVVGSIAGGALSMPTVAWIPALFVIVLGMSLCLCGVQVYRLQVLKDLRTNPIPQDLLDRWIVYISGVDYIRNREVMYRIHQIMDRLADHYKWPKDDMLDVVADLLPDVSGTAGMLEFAKKKSLLNMEDSSPALLSILQTINETHAKEVAEEHGETFEMNAVDETENRHVIGIGEGKSFLDTSDDDDTVDIEIRTPLEQQNTKLRDPQSEIELSESFVGEVKSGGSKQDIV
eukprot:CAMPEP_0117738550 /NCGR_PEP_ID=MMETSP0947-20121206/3200_1 /TAXON_ID=44440 /ORGANISM="Chattonella subsalsa, Strain CCMP2191" /LENGTH=925 /DNA_ID=CAMNT_0005554269 /DNA_START=157 /DNA_END=2935 /DNA_ORIENTATION=-